MVQDWTFFKIVEQKLSDLRVSVTCLATAFTFISDADPVEYNPVVQMILIMNDFETIQKVMKKMQIYLLLNQPYFIQNQSYTTLALN